MAKCDQNKLRFKPGVEERLTSKPNNYGMRLVTNFGVDTVR